MSENDTDSEEIVPIVQIIDRESYCEIRVNNKVFLRDEAREFKKLTDAEIEKPRQKFMINFRSCQYISSEGLGCIADFWRNCTEERGFIMVALFDDKPVNELLNFFEIIGLARVMEGHIFTSQQEAEEYLSSS